MSQETMLMNAEEAIAWDSYAAASIGGTLNSSNSPQQAVAVAVQLADLLLAERRARLKKAGSFLTTKKP
jgi:hypothetical protein